MVENLLCAAGKYLADQEVPCCYGTRSSWGRSKQFSIL